MPESPEPERKLPNSRRSFGKAFAKLFNGPNSSSVPQSPARVQRRSTFGNDFEPTEFRPCGSNAVRHYRDNNTCNQQPELAEEADEACSPGLCLSSWRTGAGSRPSSKRPSLSEPALFCGQEQCSSNERDQERLHFLEPEYSNLSGRPMNSVMALANGDASTPMLRPILGGAVESNGLRMRKASSFPTSTTTTESAICDDRVRHWSFPKMHLSSSSQCGLSACNTLLASQTRSSVNSDGLTEGPFNCGDPWGDDYAINGAGHAESNGGCLADSPAGPSTRGTQGPMFRTSANAVASDSMKGGENLNCIPRLCNSESLTDYITRLNRMRFNSHCAIGQDPREEEIGNQRKFTRKESVQSQNETNVNEQFRPEIRSRGYTVGGNSRRHYSGKANASGQNRRKWADEFALSELGDDIAEVDHAETGETVNPYDALLLLTSSEGLDPPPINFNPQSYAQFSDYLAASLVAHSSAVPTGDLNQVPSERINRNAVPRTKSKNSEKKGNASGGRESAPGAVDQKDTISALDGHIRALRAELALAKQRCDYERHYRNSAVERNRKLHGRLKQLSALEEQSQAQRDQLRLQENEIRQLTAAVVDLRTQNLSQRQEFANKEYQLTARLQNFQRDNDTLRTSLVASKRTADELLVENRNLKKELGSFAQRLFDKEAAYTQLQEKCDQDLPQAKQTVAQLNNELFVMGERNRRLRTEVKAMRLRKDDVDALRERLRVSEESWKQESSGYRKLLRKEKTKLDASNQRVQELEAQLQKRQAQIAESKRRLDVASEMHEEQLAACQMKYQALLTACQRQEVHILELYDKLEAKLAPVQTICAGDGDNSGTANGYGLLENGEMEPAGPTAVDIPARTGTTPEIRSYDSCHSASYSVLHRRGTAFSGCAVGEAGSCQSSELYLPYLFNFDHVGNQHDESEGSCSQQEIISIDEVTRAREESV